jgi:polar amino acid transport system permease protein
MSAPTAPTAPGDAEDADDRLGFQPHRRWYRRPDVVVPLALVLIGFTILVAQGGSGGRYQSRFTAERDLIPDWEYLWHLVPQMVRGLYVTARATVIGFLIAVTLGFVMALGRRSRVRAIAWPTALFIEFIRSTPILVQLVFLQALTRATPAISLTGVQVLIIGLGVHYATYCSEGYRSGINSVPPGQWEAATALNLSPWTTWTQIIIPQAIPNTLPALGNYLVAGFKDAPIADAVVAVPGVLFFANTIRADDFRPVEPYLLIGIGFLLVSLPAAWLVRRLERRLAYERI